MLKLSLASRARDYRSAANGRRRARDPARMILFDDDIEEANELYIYIIATILGVILNKISPRFRIHISLNI